MLETTALAFLRANRSILQRDERVLVRDIAHHNMQLEHTRQTPRRSSEGYRRAGDVAQHPQLTWPAPVRAGSFCPRAVQRRAYRIRGAAQV
jgi:hypothetical protein